MSSKEVWNQLVTQTKKKSKDHAALAEIYSTHITQRCTNINEDLHRMYRKVSYLQIYKWIIQLELSTYYTYEV